MKFRVERDVLAEAVTWVARGLPARPPVPVLAGVLVDANEDGTLTLSAFDYEVSARITVPADVAEAGQVLVLGRLLADISRNLPNKPIDVSTDGTKVNVACGSSRFALREMPVADYPTLPASPDTSGTIAGDVFTQAVAQVSIAADKGDTLPILTGVRMEIDGDKVTLLATDRYRLAMRELTWSPSVTDASHVALIPARQLSDTARALGASGSVELALGQGGDGLIGFEAGQRRATTRLLDGEYPKVTSIFPTSVDTTAVIETAALEEAVKRVALVAERNTPVLLKFTDGQVAIEAGTGDDAQASEAVEATLDGPEIQIAFNPQFLLDGLHAVGTAWSRLSFTQPSRPAVLSGQAEADSEPDTSYRYVLMPVRFAS
ncbi:DNA polymerase III subunit beta [Terrabacter aerolatus]|uniref:DNA polymerase III subunit beta n=1 Tax=Terrabacter aerolatus TaxID=422442 RepID=UPI0011BED045|nr:DNA polymerase III subunit beta [Terrabacter aerolatus]